MRVLQGVDSFYIHSAFPSIFLAPVTPICDSLHVYVASNVQLIPAVLVTLPVLRRLNYSSPVQASTLCPIVRWSPSMFLLYMIRTLATVPDCTGLFGK